MAINIIGIDCATQPAKTGLAQGRYAHGRLSVDQAYKPGKRESVAAWVQARLSTRTPTLLAIDAPLGWPMLLGTQLAAHRAGQALEGESNALFRRDTDLRIKRMTGKQPLDVGADRIARTAHAALALLDEIRRLSGHPLPLAWDPRLPGHPCAIEVYPAATLSVRGLPATGYKRPEHRAQREALLARLSETLSLNTQRAPIEADDDILDAVVCLVAGADFLSGTALAPGEPSLAEKEGWIWVRDPAIS